MILRDVGAAVHGTKHSGMRRAVVVGLTAALVIGLIAALAVGSSPARSGVSTNLVPGAPIAAGPPTVARAVTAVPENAAATVSFVTPVSNGGSAITGYIVTAYSGGVQRASIVLASSATTGVVDALANGKSYVFEVAARNAVAVGPESKPSAPITVGAPTSPTSPSATPGNASATVRFKAPASANGAAVTGYVLTPYVAHVAQRPTVVRPTATSATVTGLANAKTYTFALAARNARGVSTQSRTTSVTIGAPTAPTHVTDRRSAGTARTQWSAPSTDNGSPITGYKIRVYLAGVFQRDVHFGSTATSETVTGLQRGGAYAFSVAAQNARGFGPGSVLSCVPMLLGQADIDAQPAGIRFCLSGTHNWTLTPKSGDTLTGPAVLDGVNLSSYAVVAANGVNRVTLSTLEIRNYIAGAAIGAIHTPDPRSTTAWTLDNLQVHDIGNGTTDGAGAELGVGWHVVGGRYYDTRQEGLTAGGGATNFVVDGVELDHNDFTTDAHTTRAHSCGDEGGGFKFVASNVTIENSYIHDNACSGLWSDLSSNNLTITNNRLVDNWEQGVILEISGAATISHNVVTGNGFHMQNANNNGCGWGWGGGITLSTSGQTHTSNGPIDIGFNDVEANCNGITGVDQFRNEHRCDVEPKCELAHIRVHDNKIVGSTHGGAPNLTGAWRDDHDDLATHSIVFVGNTFARDARFCDVNC
jgi:parallel beta-helix repeat protein